MNEKPRKANRSIKARVSETRPGDFRLQKLGLAGAGGFAFGLASWFYVCVVL